MSPTQKDGAWYPMTPGQHVATVKVYANYTRKVAFHGRVARFNLDTQKWEHEHCPHNHYKRKGAVTCSGRAAARLNKDV